MELCEGKDVSVNMISKSGTTTEPAIAFRVFREMLEKSMAKRAQESVFTAQQIRLRAHLRLLQTKRVTKHS